MDQDSRTNSLDRPLSRRALLKWLLALPAPLLIAACTGQTPTVLTQAASATSVPPTQPSATPRPTQAPPTQAPPTAAPPTQAPPTQAPPTAAPPTQAPSTPTAQAALVPTPACPTGNAVTLEQTEGPYFKANAPQRTSLLEPGMAGTRLVVTGYLLTTDCKPVAGARVDFWQADDKGQYDNAGYRLRGYQLTDAAGRYSMETIVPGLYPGRTRHIHVKIQAPNKPVLTTQLYFPGEPANQRDGIYNKALEMQMQDTANGKTGTFNFVLKV
ncbi:MAG: dioxygenase [Anaerolineae bacterium]|nr:dioxygenase [Anaerolineae bacterium]